MTPTGYRIRVCEKCGHETVPKKESRHALPCIECGGTAWKHYELRAVEVKA